MAEADRLELLTRPGGAFPLVQRIVGGWTLQMFDREPRTLREAFLATRAHGDRAALIYKSERWTYTQQWNIVTAFAHSLRDEYGVGHGDRVAIAMRNYPEFAFSCWAAHLLGAVVVPLNAWLKSAELSALIAGSGPTVLIADEERLAQTDRVDLAGHGVRARIGVRTKKTRPDVAEFSLLAHSETALPVPDCLVEPEDTATIVYTSGTTASPKGAAHTHQNHTSSLLNKLIRAVGVTAQADDADRVIVGPPPASTKLVTYPLFHIAGLTTLYSAAYSGHTIVLMYKWDAELAVQLVEREGVNELAGPALVAQTFLDAARGTARDIGTLRTIGMGGSSTPVELIRDIDSTFGGTVIPRTGYGMTETTSGIAAISGAELVARPTSAGRALPTVQIAISDSAGRVLDNGSEGEIVVAAPQVIAGYYGIQDGAAFTDGWYHTGDLGHLDADGYLFVSGRIKDVVIRGGENVHCAEVEACLCSHSDVVEAAVFGIAHPTLGEELAAVVHVRTGADVGRAELHAYVSGRIAAFKAPTRIALTGNFLARTPSGKVVKRTLVEDMGLAGALESV